MNEITLEGITVPQGTPEVVMDIRGMETILSVCDTIARRNYTANGGHGLEVCTTMISIGMEVKSLLERSKGLVRIGKQGGE
jgi:hypothetical protein